MNITMNKGDKFRNGKIQYTVIEFTNSLFENLAILKRHTYCPYVVARDITKKQDGTYTWAWAHYFNSLGNAQADFNERLSKLI